MPEIERTIKRIVKVNHAGEFGAIRIYQAQLFVCQLFFKDLAPFLGQILGHEIAHCLKFKDAMPRRKTRPCRSMWIWSLGGYVLGLTTALMGRNSIMVCTEAVEDTVHRHMHEQIDFLQDCDPELQRLIEEIMVEELNHLEFARERVKHNWFTRLMAWNIALATGVMIWLSTHGDMSRMKRDLRMAAG